MMMLFKITTNLELMPYGPAYSFLKIIKESSSLMQRWKKTNS